MAARCGGAGAATSDDGAHRAGALIWAEMSGDPRFSPERRRPDAVALVWLAGAALAVLAYAVGPDRVVAVTFDAFHWASFYLDQLVHNLTTATLEALRAAAIGLFAVFVGLSLLAIRRGAQGPGGLIVVAIIFLLLVWGAEGTNPAANLRWALALLLAALAALGATRRMTSPPGPPRG